MGFKSRYQDLTCYFETVPIGRSSTRRYLQSTREAQRWVWTSAIPAWEKEFCLKIGSFTWDNFLNCKNYTYHFENILNWNDLAAEEAFQHPKNRFYVEFHNFPFVETFKLDPNLYIEEIDWNSEIDPELLEELELALMQEEQGEGDENLIPSYLRRTYDIPIEEIIPTGWDDDSFDKWNVLTGLIVGDHSSCGEGAQVTRS
ncbi:uncharacterized protein LOC132599644 [Lycium barbarum]|uniref:uncharacterized protein LOC132599644 n=1 Tax=Lycium barbarum TaxID=112863 RepID=UPI00293E4669|nr:uncharacterized protein LOC132599644 [Lycium barbarum]